MLLTLFRCFFFHFFFRIHFLYERLVLHRCSIHIGRSVSHDFGIYFKILNTLSFRTHIHIHLHIYTGQYPYHSSTNGYASEPERNYNSNYSIKYKTLDRRRNPSSEKYVTIFGFAYYILPLLFETLKRHLCIYDYGKMLKTFNKKNFERTQRNKFSQLIV